MTFGNELGNDQDILEMTDTTFTFICLITLQTLPSH